MSGQHDNAVEALIAIYDELPAYMMPRNESEFNVWRPEKFEVIKFSNIRRIRTALAELAEHLGVEP